MEHITIDDWKKIEIKIGRILSAEPIPNSEKLLKLSVDFGEESPRQVLSGIAAHFPQGEGLSGRSAAFVTNLIPRDMMGLESQAMILAVSGEHDGDPFFSLLQVGETAPPGASVK